MKNLYLYLSSDEYLIKKTILDLLKNNDLDSEILESYDLDENDFTDLISCLNTISVFDDKRIFWVKNPSILETSNDITSAELEMFDKYCSSKDNINVLIFSSTNYNKSNKLSKSTFTEPLILTISYGLETSLTLSKSNENSKPSFWCSPSSLNKEMSF